MYMRQAMDRPLSAARMAAISSGIGSAMGIAGCGRHGVKRLQKAILATAGRQHMCSVAGSMAGADSAAIAVSQHGRAVQQPIDLAAVAGHASVQGVGHLTVDVASIGVAGGAQPAKIEDAVGQIERIVGPGDPVDNALFENGLALGQFQTQANTRALPFFAARPQCGYRP